MLKFSIYGKFGSYGNHVDLLLEYLKFAVFEHWDK